jgi:hypothetical protein
MAQLQVPAVAQSVDGYWNEVDRDLYNRLPYWLQEENVKRRKNSAVYSRLVGKTSWKPNMGDTMKAVRKEPSPHVRQTAVPVALSVAAQKDVYGVNEASKTEVLRHQKHESNVFNFIPSFQDFMRDHITAAKDDINDKQIRFDDLFIRTYIEQKAPRVFLPGRAAGETIDAPTGFMTGIYKSTAWIQGQIAELLLSGNGSLTIRGALRALNVLEDQLRVPAFSGGGLPAENQGYNGDKFVLVTSGEWWGSLLDDNDVNESKSNNLDLLFGPFKGSLHGRLTTIFDTMPHRYGLDGTEYPPEIIDGDSASDTYGETFPNPNYYNPLVSPIELAYLVGGDGGGYRSIGVGAPPSEFSGKSMSAQKYRSLNWNGEIKLTDDIILQYPSGVIDTNKYGEYLQMISYAVHGIIGIQTRNILPIFHVRKGAVGHI